MLITLAFGLLFFGSCFLLWYRISEKIPEVVAIHDDVITQRLHEDSARLRIFLLHFKTFYKEAYYHNIFWNFFVLKIDNSLIGLLKKIRTRGGPAPVLSGLAGLAASEQQMHEQTVVEKIVEEEKKPVSYWSGLKEDAVATHSKTSRRRYIEKVRVRAPKSTTGTARRVSVKSKLEVSRVRVRV